MTTRTSIPKTTDDQGVDDEQIEILAPGYLRLWQVAEALELDDWELREAMENGQVKFLRIGGACVFVPYDVLQYAKSRG